MEYIGIGTSAHSFYNGERFYYGRSFEDFYSGIKNPDGKGGTEEEFIMLNLRLKRGLIFREFEEKYGHKISDRFFMKAELFCKAGYMKLDKEKAFLTPEGYLVSNAIISELI